MSKTPLETQLLRLSGYSPATIEEVSALAQRISPAGEAVDELDFWGLRDFADACARIEVGNRLALTLADEDPQKWMTLVGKLQSEIATKSRIVKNLKAEKVERTQNKKAGKFSKVLGS